MNDLLDLARTIGIYALGFGLGFLVGRLQRAKQNPTKHIRVVETSPPRIEFKGRAYSSIYGHGIVWHDDETGARPNPFVESAFENAWLAAKHREFVRMARGEP